MALKWLTAMFDTVSGPPNYVTPPREADSYEEATRRAVENLERFSPHQVVYRGGRFVDVSQPRYQVHTLLDLSAGGLDDVNLVQLVDTVPLFKAVFEAGRMVAHIEAAEREQ